MPHLTNNSMGSKNLVLLFEWQHSSFGGVLLLFKLEPDGSSTTRIPIISYVSSLLLSSSNSLTTGL